MVQIVKAPTYVFWIPNVSLVFVPDSNLFSAIHLPCADRRVYVLLTLESADMRSLLSVLVVVMDFRVPTISAMLRVFVKVFQNFAPHLPLVRLLPGNAWKPPEIVFIRI